MQTHTILSTCTFVYHHLGGAWPDVKTGTLNWNAGRWNPYFLGHRHQWAILPPTIVSTLYSSQNWKWGSTQQGSSQRAGFLCESWLGHHAARMEKAVGADGHPQAHRRAVWNYFKHWPASTTQIQIPYLSTHSPSSLAPACLSHPSASWAP